VQRRARPDSGIWRAGLRQNFLVNIGAHSSERAYPPSSSPRSLKGSWPPPCDDPGRYGGQRPTQRRPRPVMEGSRLSGNGAACHAPMYTMGTLLRHGSPGAEGGWRRRCSGELRVQFPASPSRIRFRHAQIAHDSRARGRSHIVMESEIGRLRAGIRTFFVIARTTARSPEERTTAFRCLVDMRLAQRPTGLAIQSYPLPL